jgi:hypothetical protein
MAMSSPTLSLSAVDEYAESFIAPRISRWTSTGPRSTQ